MINLIDIGNSNIVVATYDGELMDTSRYTTDTTKSIDEYYTLLKDVLKDSKGMVISSVVPELNIIFKNLAIKYLSFDPIFVGPGLKTGIKIMVDNPKEVGADLVASAAAAIAHYGDDAIIIDMGTATTITYIEKKVIKGVAITAGLVTQRDCLIGGTSQLTQFEFKKPAHVVATNTVDCLNAGLLYGHAKMLEGMVGILKKNHDNIPVLLTGGAARFISDLVDESFIYDEYLLIKGLIVISEKNIKKDIEFKKSYAVQ